MFNFSLLVLIFFFNFLYAKPISWSCLSKDYSKIIEREKSTLLLAQFSNSSFISGARKGSRAWHKKYGKIEFDIKTDKNFVIIISVNTSLGSKELIYTSGDKNGTNYLGLGQFSIDNEWHTFSRNIQTDLEKFYPNHKLKSINAMVIKGSLSIRNILFRKRLTRRDIESSKFLSHLNLKANIPYKKNTSPPKIFLKKNSVLFHPLGEEFFIPHVEARDMYGNNINVETVGYVDAYKVGRYYLHYIATDRAGNVTTENQLVIVQKELNSDSFLALNQKSNKIIQKSITPVSNMNKEKKEESKENVSDFVMSDEMILENEYLQQLIANDFQLPK